MDAFKLKKGTHASSLSIIANRLGELSLYDSQHECFMPPGTTLYMCTVLHVQFTAIYLIQWKHDVKTRVQTISSFLVLTNHMQQ